MLRSIGVRDTALFFGAMLLLFTNPALGCKGGKKPDGQNGGGAEGKKDGGKTDKTVAKAMTALGLDENGQPTRTASAAESPPGGPGGRPPVDQQALTSVATDLAGQENAAEQIMEIARRVHNPETVQPLTAALRRAGAEVYANNLEHYSEVFAGDGGRHHGASSLDGGSGPAVHDPRV